MKTKISLKVICLIFAFLLLFSACSAKEYENAPEIYGSYYYNTCMCGERVNAEADWFKFVNEYWDGVHPPSTKTYNDNGNEIVLSYRGQDMSGTLYYGVGIYSESDYIVLYDIQSGEILELQRKPVDSEAQYNAVKNGTAVTKEEAIEIAKAFKAERFGVKEEEKAEVVERPYTYNGLSIPCYVVCFPEISNGYATNAETSITVTATGEFSEYTFVLTDKFDDIKIDIDEERLASSIEAKIRSVYDTENSKYLSHSVTSQRLCITAEGYIGIDTALRTKVYDLVSEKEIEHVESIFTVIDEFQL